MKKPYWIVKGNTKKFYKFEDAQQVANDIANMGFGKPTITYFRMLGSLWVSTTFGESK